MDQVSNWLKRDLDIFRLENPLTSLHAPYTIGVFISGFIFVASFIIVPFGIDIAEVRTKALRVLFASVMLRLVDYYQAILLEKRASKNAENLSNAIHMIILVTYFVVLHDILI